MMKYTITSDKFTLGKKGESVDAKELLGFNIEALISAGHIAKESASIKTEEKGAE
jgi:hypothetical protein